MPPITRSQIWNLLRGNVAGRLPADPTPTPIRPRAEAINFWPDQTPDTPVPGVIEGIAVPDQDLVLQLANMKLAPVPMEIESPFDSAALGLKEIGNLASWTVSSCKPGCGVEALRDDNTSLFWQYVSSPELEIQPLIGGIDLMDHNLIT